MPSGPFSAPAATEIALLDRNGVIVQVDEGWRAFCLQNGGDLAQCGVGVSYLDVCDAASDDPATAATATAIRAAISGEGSTLHRVRLPCEGPASTQWFDLVVTSRFDDTGACIGAAVVLLALPPTPDGPAPGARQPPAALPLDVTDILDAVNDGIVILEAATLRRVYVNHALLATTGYCAEETGRMPKGLPLAVQDAGGFDRAVHRAVETGTTVSVDVTLRQHNGESLPVEARISYRPPPIPTAPGYVVVVMRDLRERLAASERVRLSEESFRAAFEQAPIGMMVLRLHPDGRRTVVRTNAAMGDLLGVPAEQLPGRDMADFSDAEEEASMRQSTRLFLRGTRASMQRRRTYRRADGSSVWVDLSLFTVDFPAAEGTTVLAHVVDATPARELELARLRRASLSALAADITARVALGGAFGDVQGFVVRGVAVAFDAAAAAMVLVDDDAGRLSMAARYGRLADDLVHAAGPALAGRLLAVDSSARFGDGDALGAPALVVRLRDDDDGGDLRLLVLRAPGGEQFSGVDEELLAEFAGRAAGAVQLGLAREAHARLARLEERQRIARDLHDTVIQDLIAVGMRLDAEAERDPDARRRDQREAFVDELDRIVRRLREAVFAFGSSATGLDPRDALTEAVQEAVRVLGFRPRIHVTGPLEVIDPPVAAELQAVVREALANVARHARATSATVRVRVARGRLTLTVDDDGVGIALDASRGNGLVNVRERGRALGGDSSVEHRARGGTRLRWSVPLATGAREEAARAVRVPRQDVPGLRSQARGHHDPSP